MISHTVTTDGVILKSFEFGESDRILTVFSRDFGKISVMAKGVRRVTSRKAGSVEVGNRASLFLAHGSRFYILAEVKLIDSFLSAKNQLSTLKYYYYILELIDTLLPADEQHEDVYRLFIEVLTLLSSYPRKIFIRAFEIKLLRILGYLTVDSNDLSVGRVVGSDFLSSESESFLIGIQDAPWSAIYHMEMSSAVDTSLQHFLQFRIERETSRSLKSLQFFE